MARRRAVRSRGDGRLRAPTCTRVDRSTEDRVSGEQIYTFWDYFRNAFGRDAALRIDHLLLSPALANRLVDAQVDKHVRGWEKTSDHAPVWVELD